MATDHMANIINGSTLFDCSTVFQLVKHLTYKVRDCEFKSRSGRLFSRTFTFHFFQILLPLQKFLNSFAPYIDTL